MSSPWFFMCPVERRQRRSYMIREGLVPSRVAANHQITLTGYTKPYRPNGPLGQRSTLTLREYKCLCGYTGMSNHIDLQRMEERG